MGVGVFIPLLWRGEGAVCFLFLFFWGGEGGQWMNFLLFHHCG